VRALPLLTCCALALSGGAAQAQPDPTDPTGPKSAASPSALSGLTFAASLGAGGETGMTQGKAGLLELEVAAGWEHQPTRLRPELAVALGIAPESSIALRPGLRAGLAQVPIWLRAAIDFSTARDHGMHTRWLLFGAAWELQFNTSLAFDLGLDFGIPLASSSGVPLMLRAGGTFRL
jgi:hypothetical protein